MPDQAATLEISWRSPAAGDADDVACAIAEGSSPFLPVTNAGRLYDERLATRVFLRDGFRDRYRDGRLSFPPVFALTRARHTGRVSVSSELAR